MCLCSPAIKADEDPLWNRVLEKFPDAIKMECGKACFSNLIWKGYGFKRPNFAEQTCEISTMSVNRHLKTYAYYKIRANDSYVVCFAEGIEKDIEKANENILKCEDRINSILYHDGSPCITDYSPRITGVNEGGDPEKLKEGMEKLGSLMKEHNVKVSPLNGNMCPLPMTKRGKVREVYDVGEDQLLIVATDKVSANDSVLKSVMPNKGEILTKLSRFWFEKLYHSELFPENQQHHHFLSTDLLDLPEAAYTALVKDNEGFQRIKERSMIVRKARALPIEAIVRGFITGSGFKDYTNNGKVCGIELPKGMKEFDKFEKPIFTPSTKAAVGDHDENVSEEYFYDMFGKEVMDEIKMRSLNLFISAATHASLKGILIADTKFEFGLDKRGKVILIDEIFTPDSSRFWPIESYEKNVPQGLAPESFDKQIIRNHLKETGLNGNEEELPEDVVMKTQLKYYEILTRLAL